MTTNLPLARVNRAKPILIFALSGLGKSTLCARFPALTYDTDVAFDDALSTAFPKLSREDRYKAWRKLAQSEPWRDSDRSAFRLWAETRRRFVADILAVLEAPKPVLVLTNLNFLPWKYRAYYGVELGQYEAHWRGLDRVGDNGQTEASNNRLEGFSPLVRLPAGRFLSDDPLILQIIDDLTKMI